MFFSAVADPINFCGMKFQIFHTLFYLYSKKRTWYINIYDRTYTYKYRELNNKNDDFEWRQNCLLCNTMRYSKIYKNFFSQRIALDFQKELYIIFFVIILKTKHDFFKLLSKQMTQWLAKLYYICFYRLNTTSENNY